MAGALAPQPPDPYEDAAPPAPGALSSANGSDYQDEGYPVDYEQEPTGDDYYKNTGRQVLQGALSQIAGQGKARSEAAAGQIAAIERAKANLRLLGNYAPDPFRAFMAGLGRGTSSGLGAEAVQNAVAASRGAFDARRQFETGQINAQNELDLAGAKIPWDLANAQEQETDRRLRLGEQFLTSAEREENTRQAVRDRLENNRAQREQARINQENLNAYRENLAANQRTAEQTRRDALEQGRWQWQPGMGPDPDDKDKQVQGIWQLPTRGDDKPIFHAEGTITGRGGANLTSLQSNIEYMVANKLAPDKPTAFAALKTAATNPQEHQRLVLSYAKAMQRDQGALGGANQSMAQLVQNAEQVLRQAELQATTPAGQPINANTAVNPGFQTNMPLPQRAAAPAPAAVPAAVPGGANTAANPGFQTNMPMPAASAAPAVPAGGGATADLPPQVRSALKEGIATTLKAPDGSVQQWTLKGGQPVRLK